jgi:hypothetical protein
MGFEPIQPKGGTELFVVEAAANAMANRWKEMGLTKVQAVDWMDRFYHELPKNTG